MITTYRFEQEVSDYFHTRHPEFAYHLSVYDGKVMAHHITHIYTIRSTCFFIEFDLDKIDTVNEDEGICELLDMMVKSLYDNIGHETIVRSKIMSTNVESSNRYDIESFDELF